VINWHHKVYLSWNSCRAPGLRISWFKNPAYFVYS